MRPDYDTTLARIAGNIAAGLVHVYTAKEHPEAIATLAVEMARAIVARVKATDPGASDDDKAARKLAELEARHAGPAPHFNDGGPRRVRDVTWAPIATAPHDRTIVVYAPGREGLPPMVSHCRYHPDAGFCIDELREPSLWTELPAAAAIEAVLKK
jgi:hypothetical protein